MFRRTSQIAIAAAIALMPTLLLAGGPPRLSFPIEGVTAETADTFGLYVLGVGAAVFVAGWVLAKVSGEK